MAAIQATRLDVNLYIVPPPEKSSPALSPTAEKVIKIAASILTALGICLIMACPAILGMAAAGTVAASSLSCVPSLIALGVISLISGSRMLQGTIPKFRDFKVGDFGFTV